MKKELSLRERAIAYLARRDHSRAELARKLARYADDPEEVSAVVDDLVRRKLLSDDRYAESRGAALARKFGVARIENELRAKGVGAEAIAKVAAAARASELDRAREAWTRRFGVVPASTVERARQIRFLQSRGFGFDVIRRVVAGADEEG